MEGDSFSLESWRRCGDFGLLGLSVPAELGGGGFGALTTARVIEAFGRSCTNGGLLFSAAAHLFACTMPILEFGDADLKASVVPRLARGELIGANAITEAEAGSDVAALRTTATRDGDHYVLNGSKSYVTNGPVADVFLVYASTQAKGGFFGLSAFVLDKSTPGAHRRAALSEDRTARGAHRTDLFRKLPRPRFSPGGRSRTQGMPIFQASMAWERGCLFAAYLGAMERDLAIALSFARERSQFGRPIGKNQAVAHRIADMKLRLEGARLLLYRSCWLKDRGQESTLDISLAKLAVSEAAVQSGLDLIRIHGSLGVSSESRLRRTVCSMLSREHHLFRYVRYSARSHFEEPRALMLGDLVSRSAARRPDELAVRGPDGDLSYAELDARANRVARALAAAGVGAGDRVAIWLPKGAEAVAAMQGVLRLGAAYVPVDPLSPPARARTVMLDCGVRALIAERPEAAASGARRRQALGQRPAPTGRERPGGASRPGRRQSPHLRPGFGWPEGRRSRRRLRRARSGADDPSRRPRIHSLHVGVHPGARKGSASPIGTRSPSWIGPSRR